MDGSELKGLDPPIPGPINLSNQLLWHWTEKKSRKEV
nr:MAG TPA: hypothetical protein [Caudoviricetes sp.]